MCGIERMFQKQQQGILLVLLIHRMIESRSAGCHGALDRPNFGL